MKKEVKELWKLMYEENEGMISVLDLSIPSTTCVEAEKKGEKFIEKLDEIMEENNLENEHEKASLFVLILSIVKDIHDRPEEFIHDFIDDIFISIGDVMNNEINKYTGLDE